MSSRRSRRVSAVALTLLTATLFQFGSCSLGDAGRWVLNFNPCGSILNCDPAQYEFIRSDYDGPGVDPQVNVFCTFPPWCPAEIPVYAPARRP